MLRKYKLLIIICLFLIILIGTRLLWLELFMTTEQASILNGELDLREWDANTGHTLSLDGEWELYPQMWIMSSDFQQSQQTNETSNRQLIKVPGSWDKFLDPEQPSPYGYGTYRLRILVNPEDRNTYSIFIPSVRSSFELFVNGQLLGKSGQPATHAEEYTPKNVPYTASFSAEGKGTIEIVLQVANFSDPRGSGLIRSLKFGTEVAIHQERYLSIALQVFIAVALLIHAIYMLILFVINKEKKFFYFSILLLSTIFIILNSSEDKLIQSWVPLSLEWSFRLMCLSSVFIAYSLIHSLQEHFPMSWRTRIVLAYKLICFVTVGLALFLPVSGLILFRDLFYIITGPGILIAISLMLRTALRGKQDNLLVILAFLAFASHFVWWGIFLATGIKVLYYPFDLLLALLMISSIWIKRYDTLYQEQKELATQLQQVDKLKDEFLANTSHELRNPLHGILTISQVVLEKEKQTISKKSAQDLELVLSVGRRMSIMLDDLLDITRLRESHIQLHLRNLSIQSVASGVLDMVCFLTEGKPIRLVNHIPANFPLVLADENRLIQILFNLLHNAVKFTQEGEVSIKAYVQGEKAYIVITDTGVGMDEETKQRIFAPYEQASPKQMRMEGGFGLGLSISKQLVELHGGSIQVQSVPNQGSAFTVSLQLADPVQQDEEMVMNVQDSLVDPDALLAVTSDQLDLETTERSVFTEDRPRILAVDDDPLNLTILESILASEGYHIVTVTSARKALDLVGVQEWDLLISDVMMPEISGYELTQLIREQFTISELPILLLTARSRLEDIEHGFLMGANDYVTKPGDGRELKARVRALTQYKKSSRELLRMEAAWLQAQIQPHFFFNTLNTIAALSVFDTDRMRHLLEQFGNFLREKFKFQNTDELIPLKDELSLVRSYLFIEQERYADKLQVFWEVDEDLSLLIPPLTIQPLVENAVRHGLIKQPQGGSVQIKITDYGEYASVAIKDNGVGMKEETIQRLYAQRADDSSGIALYNVHLRLKRLYGQGLHIESKLGEGTTVSFKVIY